MLVTLACLVEESVELGRPLKTYATYISLMSFNDLELKVTPLRVVREAEVGVPSN